VVSSPGGQPEHFMFLAEDRADPRQEFLRRLQELLPGTGSVVVYNSPFELSRLRECCRRHPQFKTWVNRIEARIDDLLKPFRSFRYYHANQNGSASMKAVLPALTRRGYDHLAIQEGSSASLEFLRVTFGDVAEAERQRVRRQLEEYCGQDTEGIIGMVEALKTIVAV
jgi:Domain of unknown function(DUF2779)